MRPQFGSFCLCSVFVIWPCFLRMCGLGPPSVIHTRTVHSSAAHTCGEPPEFSRMETSYYHVSPPPPFPRNIWCSFAEQEILQSHPGFFFPPLGPFSPLAFSSSFYPGSRRNGRSHSSHFGMVHEAKAKSIPKTLSSFFEALHRPCAAYL